MLSVIAVVGANWGDEGKGKITDYLAANAKFVVRYQGGSNAGHTILTRWGKFALHALPSGVFYPHVTNVVGPGVALNVAGFLKELANLIERGVPEPQIRISDRCQIVLPFHIQLDQYEEERLGANQFGSTRSGIAPFYSDKALKIGIQVADLFDRTRLESAITRSLSLKNILFTHAYGMSPIDSVALSQEVYENAKPLKPYVTDTTSLLLDAIKEKETVLLEGQLGALRDPDQGIYPWTTSSSPLAGFAPVGAGIPPHAITRIIAVTKAYSSCVGAGPFVTELFGPEGEELRKRGGDAGEYGATTGRPRRVGWFDAVATRYGSRIQGATEIALTNLDVLGHWDTIPIGVAYRINGDVTKDFPTTGLLEQAEPVFESMPGWRSDIRHIRRFGDLPKEARAYVERLEQLIETPIHFISVGPEREQLLTRHD